MVKIYGIIKRDGFVIGDNTTKILIGEYTREKAVEILKDRNFINRWNDFHIEQLIQLHFEIDI